MSPEVQAELRKRADAFRDLATDYRKTGDTHNAQIIQSTGLRAEARSQEAAAQAVANELYALANSGSSA